MTQTAISIVQELLAGATDPDVVNTLVAADATYISLAFDDTDLTKVMPWAGTHAGAGPQAILKTFQDVNRWWTVVDFTPQHTVSEGENVAIFGSFTLRSKTLGKQVTSPFSIFAQVKDEKVVLMQYMEDTFATASTFRSSGAWIFAGDPDGSQVTV